MARRRAFCAEVSHESAEPLGATASRVDHWLLVEYRGLWARDALGGSRLSERLKAHLGEQLEALPHSRILFIRRPRRRHHPRRVLYFGVSGEAERRFYRLEFEDHDDLLGLDFAQALLGGGGPPGVPLEHPLLLVCTHGKRDRCCAKFGRPLYDEVVAEASEDWVWQSTHVGGDRFAGNLVCLPEGLYFGRVGGPDVRPLLEQYLAGSIYLDRFRGRSCYPFAVQAAEQTVRAQAYLTSIDDLRLLGSHRREDGAWWVRFLAESSGEVHEVDVVAEAGVEATYLTCGAVTPQRARRFVTTGYRLRARP